jgi:hypothetical protein
VVFAQSYDRDLKAPPKRVIINLMIEEAGSRYERVTCLRLVTPSSEPSSRMSPALHAKGLASRSIWSVTTRARLFSRSGRMPHTQRGRNRLADLRVRQGRSEEAGQLLKGLEQHPDAVRTLAAFHLPRGDPRRANTGVTHRLSSSARRTLS